jgi:hypothetical protein
VGLGADLDLGLLLVGLGCRSRLRFARGGLAFLGVG